MIGKSLLIIISVDLQCRSYIEEFFIFSMIKEICLGETNEEVIIAKAVANDIYEGDNVIDRIYLRNLLRDHYCRVRNTVTAVKRANIIKPHHALCYVHRLKPDYALYYIPEL